MAKPGPHVAPKFAAAFPATRVAPLVSVHVRVGYAAGEDRRHVDVVDAQAVAALESQAGIVPPAARAGAMVDEADGVHQPPVAKRGDSGAGVLVGQRRALPPVRIRHVAFVLGRDVVVAE